MRDIYSIEAHLLDNRSDNSNPADLGVVEASMLLRQRKLSSRELVGACLARVREDPTGAWVRVYEEDALAAADKADARLADGDAPALCGIPIGLKDLYAVAGKPLSASSLFYEETPSRDCDVWLRLRSEGMVLLGHVHTHEFAAGGTTDQVGNPVALDRSAGGSSGGSAAALGARTTPAATGTDTAGSLRIPSACCGTAAMKPTRGLVSLTGVVPLSWSLDHAGPMARTIADCSLLLEAMAGPDRRRAESALNAPPSAGSTTRTLEGVRLAVSPRIEEVELDADVAAGFDAALAACRRLGAVLVEPLAPQEHGPVGDDFLDVLTTDLLTYHRR